MSKVSLRRVDLTGKRFGRLVVIEFAERINGHNKWRCQCDCGNIGVHDAGNLNAGKTTSCGCLNKEATRQRSLKHGQSQKTKEYEAWKNMTRRCYSPASTWYARYGGRGIRVCDQWLGESGFVNFFADMGPKPTPRHTIDRIDNEGDYCPENCRWVTQKRQMRNTSRTVILTHNNKTLSVGDWAEICGLDAKTIKARLNRGWTVAQSLTTPLLHQGNP